MIVQCDKCGNQFVANKRTESRTIDGVKIYRRFIKCTHCKTEYTICYDSDETNKIRNSIGRKLKSNKQTDSALIVESQSKLRSEMERLKREYEELF